MAAACASALRAAIVAGTLELFLLAGPAWLPGGLSAQSPDATLRESPVVDRVELRGVTAFDEEDVKAALSARPTRCRSVLFQPFCWFSEGGFFQERHRLDREELPRDELRIRVFYWLRGYRGAEASTEVLPSGRDVSLRFEVDEGSPTLVRRVDVVQDAPHLSERDIADARFPARDALLDMIQLRLAEQRLEDRLRDRGYANVAIDDSIDVVSTGSGATGDSARADVIVRVRAGRPVTIDGTLVRGNDEVSDRTILRALGLSSGQLFRQRDLGDAQRRLYRSNLFRQSFVTTLQDTPELAAAARDAAAVDTTVVSTLVGDSTSATPGDTTRTVLVFVREAPFDEVSLGAGISTVEFGQAQGGYTRYNFLGGGRRLDVRSSVGNLLAPQLHEGGLFSGATPPGIGLGVEPAFLNPTWGGSVEFTQPWFLSTDNSASLAVFARRRAVMGVVVERGMGGSATVTRMVSRDMPVSLGYRFEQTEVDAGEVYFCVNFGICESRTIRGLRGGHRLSPLTLTMRAERVDDPMSPRRGFTATLEAEHASGTTASDYRYDRMMVEGTGYWPVGPGVLAGRIRAGWVGPGGGTARALGVESAGSSLLHPRKRLYSGGSRSVRGYGENQLGPRILTVAAGTLIDGEPGDPGEPEPGGEEPGAGAEGCTTGSIQDRSCDPNRLPSSAFQPRPLGGNRVIEGSVEYRFPFGSGLIGAVFLDVGFVDDLDLNIPSGARGALTPGLGVRYRSPVGMIRLDLGVRPGLVERLPVVTAVGEDRERELVVLDTPKRYDPTGPSTTLLKEIYRRLVLHLSIGEAF